MSIVVVSLNPSIDWQLTAHSFVYGGLNRVQAVGRYASGKGINVCAALKNMGLDLLCVGFNYQENGDIITNALDEWDVCCDFVTVNGEVRTNIKLYDAATCKMTEFNQPGGNVSNEALEKFCCKIESLKNTQSNDSILVLSGSLPQGVPADIYQRLCKLWPVIVILDAEGEPLCKALEGDRPPFCIKPNLFELENSFGVKLASKEDIIDFCHKLLEIYGVANPKNKASLQANASGLGMICVSMGAEGAVLVTSSSVYYLPGMELEVRGVQGAGDAMVAGLVYGLKSGASDAELLKMASAAAAASITREGTQMCTGTDFEKFLKTMPKPIEIRGHHDI